MAEKSAKKKAGETADPKRAAASKEPAAPARLEVHYKKTTVPRLMKRFGYSNLHQVPRLRKICINMGVGEATQNIKLLEGAQKDLEAITGQKPAVRRAKKSVSNFKLRAGMPVGSTVTLRSARMYEFLDRLISIAIPRIRDFRGLSPRSFDGRGNYTFGIKEQIIFSEVKYDKVEKIRGMDITLATSATNDEEGFELLHSLGMPFRER